MVKVLNREIGNRMWGGKSNVYGVSSGGTGGGDVDLTGYATKEWTEQFYLSKAFFNRLFTIHGANNSTITPNDTESTITSIEAMFGFWTELYVSAMGNGGQIGSSIYLSQLADVALNNPTNGQALVYDSTTHKWVNGQASGVDMTTVWRNLAAATTEQINASHLSNALGSYVTSSALSTTLSGYVTTTSLNTTLASYATQTWVTSNFITIAYFDRLFRAYNNSTLVSHNDTTSTIDNIKAMFGFWTDFYLSALGTGGVSSVSISLSQLADVNVAGVTNGQVLSYNSTNAEWVPTTISNVTSLSALTDVALSSPTTYQVLMYDASTTKWYNSALKTINGQPLYGSGDISVGGGASGNYLPLSGGTLTGSLFLPSPTDAWGLQVGNLSTDNVLTFIGSNGLSGIALITKSSNSAVFGVSLFNSNWTSATNPFIIYGDGSLMIDAFNTHKGIIFRENINSDSFIYNMSILAYPVSNSAYDGLSINANGGVTICTGGNTRNERVRVTGTNGYVGIKKTNPSCELDIFGTLQVDSNEDRYIKLYGRTSEWYLIAFKEVGNYFGWRTSSNAFYFSQQIEVYGNIYATGAVTALSDIRHKTVIKDAAVSVEDIARMPAVMYQWNDGREDKELHVGSIAQNWQTVLPEVVLKANDEEGTLSMQYGVAALVSSIIIARKVVSHEDRIKQLEKENKELKMKLKIA